MTAVYRHPKQFADKKSIVALGNFDGIHLGHAEIIRSLIKQKKERGPSSFQAVLVSFYPHPAKILRGAPVPKLMSLRQKLEVLSEIGLDVLYLIRFTKELSGLSAPEFIDSILVDQLATSFLLVGEDAAIGRKREGNTKTLPPLLESRGIEFKVFSTVNNCDLKVSSGRIRDLLAEGEVYLASQLLGRKYAIDSRIVSGDGRGKSIGFPTANLLPTEQLFPKKGVYACYLLVDDRRFNGVVNVGIRPTFGGESVRAEVHLIGEQGLDLYGRKVRLEFVGRIRDERKFASVEQLTSQIKIDSERALEVLQA